ncbi:Mut7-C RNAse domain-containing protein [Halobellus ordinarius]|uniref:Mut7-C RNAse domain-containing protein n=1 Tax=Halobellus ordinarius TaxID=3075120 RepID=UPI002880B3A4|nr:Mut7-C RNAse domain-containing protein [Halobellus sp. ZY16]
MSDTDRLLLDAMLGKLATYLRMCGYDAAYVLDAREEGREEATPPPQNDPSDDEILQWARETGRTLVTRDVDLADRAADAVLLSSRDLREQLREVREAGYDLSLADPPVRCGACNGELRAVDPEESLPQYAPDPAETDCWRCRACGQVFWQGSHWDDVAATLAEI